MKLILSDFDQTLGVNKKESFIIKTSGAHVSKGNERTSKKRRKVMKTKVQKIVLDGHDSYLGIEKDSRDNLK